MEVSKLIRLTLFLIFGIVITSCVEVNGSGYDSLTEQEKQYVKPCKVAIEQIKQDGNLYKVKVGQVRDFINKKQNVLVYEYLPFCSGESGRSPAEVKQICRDLHLECIVISSVYDGLFPLDKYKFPVFVIDNVSYGTDNYQVYSNEFYKALTHSDGKKRKLGSFHYFRDGKYICSYTSVLNVSI